MTYKIGDIVMIRYHNPIDLNAYRYAGTPGVIYGTTQDSFRTIYHVQTCFTSQLLYALDRDLHPFVGDVSDLDRLVLGL